MTGKWRISIVSEIAGWHTFEEAQSVAWQLARSVDLTATQIGEGVTRHHLLTAVVTGYVEEEASKT